MSLSTRLPGASRCRARSALDSAAAASRLEHAAAAKSKSWKLIEARPALQRAFPPMRDVGTGYIIGQIWRSRHIRLKVSPRAVQFSTLSRYLEEVVDVEPGPPSGVFDVFARAGAKRIVGEGA